MDIMTMMYVYMAGMMVFAVVIVFAWVAGKDIILAFQRKFNPKGADVFIATPTRKITQRFLTPKDGIFRIKKLPYITNPEKIMNLTEEEKRITMDYLLRRTERLKNRIKDNEQKKAGLQKIYETTTDDRQKFFIANQIEHHDKVIVTLNDQVRMKQENYWKDKRPAFFFIEGDPIPKDFYEFYSSLDAKQVDNLVCRSISMPSAGQQPQDLSGKLKELLPLIAAGAAALACYFAFRNNAAINEICTQLGVACGL